MTSTTYDLVLTQGIGYAGQLRHRAWVAAITGTDRRVFRVADRVLRDHFGRTRYIRTYQHDLSPGLYEVSQHGDLRYLLVWLKRDGTIAKCNLDADRVREMATLMDHGQDFEAARRATRAAVAAPQ